MRKRTFQDRKFSQGDGNSDAYRANWERMFGIGRTDPPNAVGTGGETPDNRKDDTTAGPGGPVNSPGNVVE